MITDRVSEAMACLSEKTYKPGQQGFKLVFYSRKPQTKGDS
jgi:hypothetical protein